MTTTMAIIVFLQLRNEFSVCRVYTSNGTLRTSFDRRPLNPPAAGLGDQAAAHRYQHKKLYHHRRRWWRAARWPQQQSA